jgi:hypothetical protein
MLSQKRRLAQLTCDKQKIAKQSESDRSSSFSIIFFFKLTKKARGHFSDSSECMSVS